MKAHLDFYLYAVVAVFSIFFICSEVQAEHSNPAPGTSFFGQSPPGSKPEVFLSGIISGTGQMLHGPVVLSPDQTQLCWAVLPPAIMTSIFEGGIWSEPEPLALEGRGVQSPAFSHDGRRLYYQAFLEGGKGSIDIYWSEKLQNGWGPPVNAGAALNSAKLESQPCPAADGTLFFTATLEGVGFDRGIYRARLVDGEYQKPELLGGGINSKCIDYCPWIAPDQSYLLFASSRPRTEEPLYLHISFQMEDGSWSVPRNIHQSIGFEDPARFPSVSPDGRFLFFISGKDAFWVDISTVLGLREESVAGGLQLLGAPSPPAQAAGR